MTREETIHELVEWLEQMIQNGVPSHPAKRKALATAIALLSAEAVPQSEQYKKGFEDAKRAFLVEYARESKNMRKRKAQLEVMLNAQKAISAEAEWIPCSERLPGKNQEVLLQCHHNMIVGYWMDGDFDGEKEWRVLSGDGWESGCDFPIDVFEPLAWMPLPKPYKEMEP